MIKKTYYELELKLPTTFTQAELQSELNKRFKKGYASYLILKQSLDARKSQISWLVKLAVFFTEQAFKDFTNLQQLSIPKLSTSPRIAVVGSGPAGFFSAYILASAGAKVTLLEQGKPVEERSRDIQELDKKGVFHPFSNYAFGEGGAGTFSDGKLTSRTKNIDLEKNLVYQTFIKAGAPPEIAYLNKPHLGSDNLISMSKKMRQLLVALGVDIRFHTQVTELKVKNNRISALISQKEEMEIDYCFFAPGHSSYATYRMLLKHQVPFRPKPFALGVRVEHPQRLINFSQWKKEAVPGLKAAEYRLTHKTAKGIPVFSFCMCPGGKVVPAATEPGQNIVNGASNYSRNGALANSAIIAGLNPQEYFSSDFNALNILSWLEEIEHKSFTEGKNTYRAPANIISSFLQNKTNHNFPPSSYSLGLYPSDFKNLLPAPVLQSLQEGLLEFSKRIPGFERGLMLGLETKTSAPLQVIREAEGHSGFSNLFIVGEGSGYAGGIISSAVDGLKSALNLIEKLK